MKKLLIMAVLGCALFAASAGAASYTCSIDMVGPEQDGTVWIQLTEANTGWFSDRWFKMEGSTVAVNRMLAVAIAAMNSDKDVLVTVSSVLAASNVSYIALVK